MPGMFPAEFYEGLPEGPPEYRDRLALERMRAAGEAAEAEGRDLTREQIAQRLLDAQAELQTGLGMFRLRFPECSFPASVPPIVGYLDRSLAMQQRLLSLLGTHLVGAPDADVEGQA